MTRVGSSRGVLARLDAWWGAPVGSRPLALLRIATGLALVYEGVSLLEHDWARTLFVGPSFHFHYGSLAIPVLPLRALQAVFVLQIIAGVALATGVAHRLAATVGVLAFGYVFLLDQALYLNHFYLLCLLLSSFVFLPAGSLRDGAPIPRGALAFARFHVALPYVFGGIAKLQADWLAGRPLGGWLADRTGLDILSGAAAAPVGWATAMFDLAIVPALVYRRTRVTAFVLACTFHLANAQLFHIGVFPWLMIGATCVFFDLAPDGTSAPRWAPSLRSRVAMVMAFGWVAVHCALPLRGHLHGRNISWTGDGHEFAWRMKLHALDSHIDLSVCDVEAGRCTLIALEDRLTPLQIRRAGDRPEMLTELARALRAAAEQEGRAVVVQGDVWSSLNGRPWQRRVDPEVDLSRVDDRDVGSWVLPLAAAGDRSLTAPAIARARGMSR